MAKNRIRVEPTLVIGFILLALGAMFLVGQVFHISLWRYAWPFFIIVPGLLFFVLMVVGGPGAGPLAIPGSIVTMVGLLLLYQNTFNHWTSWAYAWALIAPTSVGVGLAIHGIWSDREGAIEAGKRIITVGLVMLIIGVVFFELILDISHFRRGPVGKFVLPVVLIGFGLLLLGRDRLWTCRGHSPARGAAPPSPPEISPVEPIEGES
jgi:hypothetical protein